MFFFVDIMNLDEKYIIVLKINKLLHIFISVLLLRLVLSFPDEGLKIYLYLENWRNNYGWWSYCNYYYQLLECDIFSRLKLDTSLHGVIGIIMCEDLWFFSAVIYFLF